MGEEKPLHIYIEGEARRPIAPARRSLSVGLIGATLITRHRRTTGEALRSFGCREATAPEDANEGEAVAASIGDYSFSARRQRSELLANAIIASNVRSKRSMWDSASKVGSRSAGIRKTAVDGDFHETRLAIVWERLFLDGRSSSFRALTAPRE